MMALRAVRACRPATVLLPTSLRVATAATAAKKSDDHDHHHDGHSHSYDDHHHHDDHGHHHDDHPNGFLFGQRPGHPFPAEGWETSYYLGFGGGFLLIGVGLYYKPDTSLKTWAAREATLRQEEKRRLQEGEQEH